jgi:hypothetical protein
VPIGPTTNVSINPRHRREWPSVPWLPPDGELRGELRVQTLCWYRDTDLRQRPNASPAERFELLCEMNWDRCRPELAEAEVERLLA